MTAPLIAAALTAGAPAVPAGAAVSAATAAAHGWHSRAVTAPQGAARNPEAQLDGIACPRATDCVAGGYYQNTAGAILPMIATESNGRWARATRLELPANAAKNPGGEVGDVACWAVGSCIAVGDYAAGTALIGLGFVATESKGSWGRAKVLPLPANAAVDPAAIFYGVACTGPASCVAVGTYDDSAGYPLPVVATESHGSWQQPREVRLPANAQEALGAQLISVACSSAGFCAVAGSYIPRSGADRGMEVIESHGTWHRGTTVLTPAGVNPKLGNFLTGVSCWSASCMATGGYSAANGAIHPMAVAYSGGRWRRAVPLRAVPRGVGPRSVTQLDWVACTAVGCTAVGEYGGGGPGPVPVAASESGGRWERAVPVTLPAGHSTGVGLLGFLHGVACVGRTCTAVGFFLHVHSQVLAMASTSG